MFTIKKVYDEGGTSPFMARHLISYCEWRDRLLKNSCRPAALPEAPADNKRAWWLEYERRMESERARLDARHTPLFEGLVTARTSAHEFCRLVADHEQKVATGAIVGFQPAALEIHENIDTRARELFEQYVNSVVRALKTGLQELLKCPPLSVDLRAFFGKRQTFEQWCRAASGDDATSLVPYLSAARADWGELLSLRRNAIEHDGWTLDGFHYVGRQPGPITAIEPQVDGRSAKDFVAWTLSGALLFAEDLKAFAFQRALAPEMVLEEIAPARLGPADVPKRFVPAYAHAIPEIPGMTPGKGSTLAYRPGGAPEMLLSTGTA